MPDLFYLLLFCDKNCELMHIETRESPETTPHYTQSYAYTNIYESLGYCEFATL